MEFIANFFIFFIFSHRFSLQSQLVPSAMSEYNSKIDFSTQRKQDESREEVKRDSGGNVSQLKNPYYRSHEF